ncbi:CsbD family protein [Nocardia salmonicida]|uniref:CsbD family protein n=1 Tax=Nocardia salmonicida TaxID=53431 RepID=UPI0033F0B8E3
MGLHDKFENKAEELEGRTKEAAGAVTGDDDLKNEGKADQASSALKQKGEKIKDKTNEIVGKIVSDG